MEAVFIPILLNEIDSSHSTKYRYRLPSPKIRERAHSFILSHHFYGWGIISSGWFAFDLYILMAPHHFLNPLLGKTKQARPLE